MTNKRLSLVYINGQPDLLKFTETPDSPVVSVEFGNAMDLIMDPRGGEICVPGLKHVAPDESVLSPFINRLITRDIERVAIKTWEEVGGKTLISPDPDAWNTLVKDKVSRFLACGTTAQRVVESILGETMVNKEQVFSTKHLEGTSQLERSGELGKFLNYITDSENVWDSDKYLANRRVSGTVFGGEADFRYMYVLGNAFLEGHIGDSKVRIYYLKLQGFQIYLSPLGEPFDQYGQRPVTYHPDNRAGVLAYFEELSIKR